MRLSDSVRMPCRSWRGAAMCVAATAGVPAERRPGCRRTPCRRAVNVLHLPTWARLALCDLSSQHAGRCGRARRYRQGHRADRARFQPGPVHGRRLNGKMVSPKLQGRRRV